MIFGFRRPSALSHRVSRDVNENIGREKKGNSWGEKRKNANNLSRKFVQMVQEMAQRARNNFQPLYQIESRNTQDHTLAKLPSLPTGTLLQGIFGGNSGRAGI